MGIHKYKTFEEAEKALWVAEVDAAYIKNLKELYVLNDFLHKFIVQKGVMKFSSFEKADKHKRNSI